MATQDIFSLNSTVTIGSEQISSVLDGETIVLHVASGIYYGLDAIGTRIWNLIQTPQAIQTLQQTLLAEYAVDPDTCNRELQSLLQALYSKGLIQIHCADE